MADIDVQALGLASPPAAPYQQSYTPGILVRNNGRAAATANGYLQCFDKVSGVLLHQWNVASGEIGPGTTGTATSAATLDLSEVAPGTQLIFSGYVSTANDQVPANNVLTPVTVTVQEGESPEPPSVPAHSAQHEDGGTDELDVSNMRGLLYDPQLPLPHHAAHQAGGTDELSLAGLYGESASPQPPKGHGNEAHTPEFLSGEELAEHVAGDPVHENADNLEQTSRKGQANGYAELDDGAKVPAAQLGGEDPTGEKLLRSDQTWVTVVPGAIPGTPVPNVPGSPPAAGESLEYARADHVHGGEGGLDAYEDIDLVQDLEIPLTPYAHILPYARAQLAVSEIFAAGTFNNTDVDPHTLVIRVRVGSSEGTANPVVVEKVLTYGPMLWSQPFVVRLTLLQTIYGSYIAGSVLYENETGQHAELIHQYTTNPLPLADDMFVAITFQKDVANLTTVDRPMASVSWAVRTLPH